VNPQQQKALNKFFTKFDSVMDTFEETMDSIFGSDPRPETCLFHCQWKSGGNFYIQGETISDAWKRHGFTRDQIADLAFYREIK